MDGRASTESLQAHERIRKRQLSRPGWYYEGNCCEWQALGDPNHGLVGPLLNKHTCRGLLSTTPLHCGGNEKISNRGCLRLLVIGHCQRDEVDEGHLFASPSSFGRLLFL